MTSTKPPARAADDELDVTKLAWLNDNAPEVYRDLMEQRALDQARNYRLLRAELGIHVFGNVSGLAALVVLALVSWHAFDRGAATQGAAIICTAAVSIVAVFVTGRLSRKTDRRREQPQA
jgi:hypothetical protein